MADAGSAAAGRALLSDLAEPIPRHGRLGDAVGAASVARMEALRSGLPDLSIYDADLGKAEIRCAVIRGNLIRGDAVPTFRFASCGLLRCPALERMILIRRDHGGLGSALAVVFSQPAVIRHERRDRTPVGDPVEPVGLISVVRRIRHGGDVGVYLYRFMPQAARSFR